MLLPRQILFLLAVVPLSDTVSASKHGGTSDSGPLPISNAEEALSTLQGWYNNDTGLWETTGWWNAANVLTMIGDFAQANPKNDQLQRLARHVLTTTCTQAPRKNPSPGAEGNATYGQGQNTHAFGPSPVSSWYHKILDENTFEPHSIYPLGWDHDTDPSGDQHALNQPPAEFNLTDSVCMTDPYKWLDGYYDDDLWWALAWINAYDLTQDTVYLRLAESIFTAVSKSWPTHCFNGGIYWNNNSTYVNAIANELFLSTAAHLANRVEDHVTRAKYEDWSKRAIDWFLRSGMFNKRNTINDGLDDACHNNNGTVWTYNQGVIIGGLVELSRLFPNNSTYMTVAHRVASATMKERTDVNGILYDDCEPECYRDGTQFKGVFMRNLQRLYRASPQELYKCLIENNARSIWEKNRENGVLSVRWAGPFKRPGNSSTHSSAMDALVAAVAVG